MLDFVRITSQLLGPSDLALRLPLFVGGLAALLLFFGLAARTLEGPAVTIALALFAVGIPFIRYSAELKQYGIEIAAAILLTSVALELRSRNPTARRCLAAGLAGLVCVFFAQAAILVLAGLGVALAAVLKEKGKGRKPCCAPQNFCMKARVCGAAERGAAERSATSEPAAQAAAQRQLAAKLAPAAGAAAAAALLLPPLYAVAAARPPYFFEHFKPVLAHLQQRYRAGDAVNVYANAYQALKRYGPRYGLPRTAWQLGLCDEENIRPYLEDVDRFRGAPRLWVIGSSVPDFHQPRVEIGRCLEKIGRRRDAVSEV